MSKSCFKSPAQFVKRYKGHTVFHRYRQIFIEVLFVVMSYFDIAIPNYQAAAATVAQHTSLNSWICDCSNMAKTLLVARCARFLSLLYNTQVALIAMIHVAN